MAQVAVSANYSEQHGLGALRPLVPTWLQVMGGTRDLDLSLGGDRDHRFSLRPPASWPRIKTWLMAIAQAQTSSWPWEAGRPFMVACS